MILPFLIDINNNHSIFNKMLKYIILLTAIIFHTKAISQNQRINYSNEIFVSAQWAGLGAIIYGTGYELTFKKKRQNYFSIQNELTTSIFSKTVTDYSRLQTLIKWNNQKMNVISLGVGTSIRLNSNFERFSFLLNSSYKYCFPKPKMSISGTIFFLLSQPSQQSNGIPVGIYCSNGCTSGWTGQFRMGLVVGKYF